MVFSRHNIFSKIKGSNTYFIVNLLSGNADLLETDEAIQIIAYQQNDVATPDFLKKMEEKGYAVDEKEENIKFRNKYLNSIDSREKDEIQIFFVSNYSCNFNCTYCYQEEYSNPQTNLTKDIIDTFFNYIKLTFAGRKKYITVFGGEPLLNSTKQKETISYLVQKANSEKLELAFVTNGYFIEEYKNILGIAHIREIQVTLDGTKATHNTRRFLKNGQGTFEKIVKGIDFCIQHQIPVNLRMVVDQDNIENLPEFAQFAIDKGWTDSPYFKTQLGRNYELHSCQSTANKLFTRITLYERIHQLLVQYPHILEFHRPAYSITKFLAENGTLPEPLFDSCPACKTEWAFDYTGQIYSCTATVGKNNESLGTFYPEVKVNQKLISEWEKRDVTAIPQCKTCNLQLSCGGGCGSVAKNKTGNICSPDCRSTKELMEIGFSLYFEEEEEEEEEEVKRS